jgi:hypothetical protein
MAVPLLYRVGGLTAYKYVPHGRVVRLQVGYQLLLRRIDTCVPLGCILAIASGTHAMR